MTSKKVSQLQVGTQDFAETLTISEIPDAGFNGKTIYRFGILKHGDDQEFARLDKTDMLSLREALAEMAWFHDAD
jgi:hypothetical protein